METVALWIVTVVGFVGLLYLASILARLAWDGWEALLRRLRPARVPEHRQADLAETVATARSAWRIWLPGLFIVVMPEASRKPKGGEGR
ncbi:hypothetical protein DNL40_02475 [Xylanimonas oleitrophica]|uniref:Uncharacterized protein n=1 Tax=Xylanimonas oleitrophica TaxID=2607479 RepID=A0A2W5X2V6_9MICO|nr:hypothetical protein [Xylanimonas oleitrophica]PZR55256.1 hypothetical protein DNL40_02475 [Xylanimonas oleitrophica]